MEMCADICSNCFRDKLADHSFCPWCGFPSGEVELRKCGRGHIIFDTYKNCFFCLQELPREPVYSGAEEAMVTEIVNTAPAETEAPGDTILEEDSLDKTVVEDLEAKTKLDIPAGDAGAGGEQNPPPSFFGWLVFIGEDGLPTEQVRLPKVKTILGKAEDVDILVTDSYASKLHSLIYFENDAFYISDLGSTNGTFLNGEPILKEPLRDGDKLRIGRQHITFKRVNRNLPGNNR